MPQYVFEADLNNLREIIDAIHDFAAKHGFQGPSLHQFAIAAEEVLVNIISYGYKNQDSGKIDLTIDSPERDWIRLVIKDKGSPFNPLEKSTDLQESLPLEARRSGGLGIYLFREMCDNSEYRRSGEYNILTLSKKMRA